MGLTKLNVPGMEGSDLVISKFESDDLTLSYALEKVTSTISSNSLTTLGGIDSYCDTQKMRGGRWRLFRILNNKHSFATHLLEDGLDIGTFRSYWHTKTRSRQ